ncbi:MAG: CRTAC1 family protein, partial [Verrucomicrobiota bacterium]
FDADGDGAQDLYVVSGGAEASLDSPAMRDRLYQNDGTGNFIPTEGALPDLAQSGGPVTAADYDRDGDLDLFIGGRVIPWQYPLSPSSYLLRNDGGRFSVSPAFTPHEKAGLVTSALWSDADNDGWVDLILVSEWGALTCYRNVNGQSFEPITGGEAPANSGWWNSVVAGDLDHDGDIDYIAGNAGLNTKYHASHDYPALIHYGDVEGTGQARIIEARYEEGTLFPERGRSCSTAAIPSLARNFPNYHTFASATLTEIYSGALNQARRFAATNLEHSVFLNKGDGTFEIQSLPRLAQNAPIFGLALQDFDADGHLDLIAAQNSFSPQPETGRYDGGIGLVLKGTGDGTFQALLPPQSGFLLPGDGKALVLTGRNAVGEPGILVTRNQDTGRAFHLEPLPDDRRRVTLELAGRTGNAEAVGARITISFTDGSTQEAEIHSGAGYLSQSARRLNIGLANERSIHRIGIRWPDGSESVIEKGLDQAHLVLKQPDPSS